MRLLFAFLAVFTLFLPQTGSAAQPETAFLSQLKDRAKTIHSIRSDFTQEKHLAMFDEVLVSTGRFAFARPSSLRWEYTKPFGAGFLLHNGNGIEWDQATGTEREFSLKSSPAMSMIARQIMAWTTFDITWLQAQYEIRQQTESPLSLELIPSSETARAFIKHLLVTFSKDNVTIDTLELHESDGDFTRILFTSTEINTPLPKTTFTIPR